MLACIAAHTGGGRSYRNSACVREGCHVLKCHLGINITRDTSQTPKHSGGGTHLPGAAHGRCTGMAQLPHIGVGEALFSIAVRQAHTWQRQCALRPNTPIDVHLPPTMKTARSFGRSKGTLARTGYLWMPAHLLPHDIRGKTHQTRMTSSGVSPQCWRPPPCRARAEARAPRKSAATGRMRARACTHAQPRRLPPGWLSGVAGPRCQRAAPARHLVPGVLSASCSFACMCLMLSVYSQPIRLHRQIDLGYSAVRCIYAVLSLRMSSWEAH